MARFEIRFMEQALRALAQLPCTEELRARRRLLEIARTMEQSPLACASLGSRGTVQPGSGPVDPWAMQFALGPVRVVYAIDVEDRAVVVRRVEHAGSEAELRN